MAQVTSVTITTYTPERSASNLQGYYIRDGTVDSMVCAETEEFIASDKFPFCCTVKSHGVCYQATTCHNNVMTDPDHDTWKCDEGTECRPMTIYESYEDSTEAWSGTQFWCFQSWAPNIVYRNLPYTEISTISASTTSAPASTSATPSQTADVPGPTDANSNSSGGSSTNTGAIAGGVVGGVAGLALIAAAAFFLVKRRKSKKQEMNEIGMEYAPRERDL